jgi:glycosyltransferase 2 family protein
LRNFILKTLKFLGFLSFGILLLYFAFKGISLAEIAKGLKTANYWWVLLSLFFAFLAYVARAHRWNIIIEPLNYHPSLLHTLYSLMVGYLANFAFPRIGEITRCASLAKKEKIPVDKLIGTVIIERAVDLLTLMILLIFLLIIRLDTFGAFLGNNVFIPISEKISNSLGFSWIIWILIAGTFIGFIALYFVFREQLSKIVMVNKVKNLVKGVLTGLKTVYQMKRRLEFIFYSILIWVLYLLMTWVLVFAVPATSSLKLIDGLFIVVIGSLGMSAPVQGGIGAYHLIVSLGLASVYSSFITRDDGMVFATISHGSQAIFAILLGSISLILLVSRKKNTPVKKHTLKVIKDNLPGE